MQSTDVSHLLHLAKGWLVLTLMCLAGSVGVGAELPTHEYLTKNWTTADGIPHNTVRSVIESRDGYLWLGTANGLARFDGVRFKNFDAANTPDFVSDNVFSLFEDSQGTLWIRTRSGLIRHSKGRFEFLSPTNSLQPVPFAGMMEDSDGTVWVQGSSRIGRWNGRTFEAIPLPANGPKKIKAVRPAVDGGLWISGENGLWRFRNGLCEFMTKAPVAEYLAVGPTGQLWGLTVDQRLLKFEQGTWVAVATVLDANCTVLYAAPNGDVWLGSEKRNAAFRWRNGGMTTFSSAEGLEGVRVLGFVQDQDGNVWIGMNAGGLYRLRERRVQIIGREEGFESPNTTSVAELADGTMMVGVMGSTWHRIQDGKAEPVRMRPSRESLEFPTAVAPASGGGMWAGTFYGSLVKVMGSEVVERVGNSNGTRALLVDRDGGLWRGMRSGGIEVFAGTNVTRFGSSNGLSFDNVYCFAQDRDGAVWAGTEQGLNRILNGRITVFGTTNGLGQQYVSALCVDSRGTLWVGTLGGGLSGWNGTRFVTLTTREGLAHDVVDQLIEDDFGHLWLGTRVGLMRLSVAQLHEFMEGKIRVVTGTIVGRDEGLLRPNLWTEYQPASAKSRDGRLWFCTGSGVAVLDPSRFEKPATAPIVHIEEVEVDDRLQPVEAPTRPVITVPPGSERVKIRYTGISPSEPAQVRFRYRLVGYDRDWVEAGRARLASYSHLPPGSYVFQVIAVNNDGAWNTAGARFSFEVQPQFWQTGWFRVLSFLAMAGALYGVYRLRLRRVELRRAAQEAFSRRLIDSQEQERKRIAGELHDSLGQNLLVIKNRAVLALRQKEEPEKMAAQVREVSDMATAAIREVRAIAQNLRPFQIDELGLAKSIVAMARSMRDSTDIDFVTDVDDVDGLLPAEFEINLYRIIQECLNNVVKHSGAKSVVLRLRRTTDSICLTVADDGRGFNQSAFDGAADGNGSFGLRSIVERARTMGGNIRCQSSPEEGTRIDLDIPAKRR